MPHGHNINHPRNSETSERRFSDAFPGPPDPPAIRSCFASPRELDSWRRVFGDASPDTVFPGWWLISPDPFEKTYAQWSKLDFIFPQGLRGENKTMFEKTTTYVGYLY